MFGLKIGKTLKENNASVWPGEYHRLDVLLKPVEDDLRSLWWATDRTEFLFPAEWVVEGWSQEDRDWEPLSGSLYRNFKSFFNPGGGSAIAKPGFLPTFSKIVSGDWSILYGLSADPTSDKPLLDALAKLDWFASAKAFPESVSVVIRGIDWAYWEVFARDQRMIMAIHDHLRTVHGLSVELADEV
jgi:hypothetical protein